MGVCYANGEGVPRDSAKVLSAPRGLLAFLVTEESAPVGVGAGRQAMELFERAASLGYYAALLTLGNCYMEGKGEPTHPFSFPKEYDGALTYFQQARSKTSKRLQSFTGKLQNRATQRASSPWRAAIYMVPSLDISQCLFVL